MKNITIVILTFHTPENIILDCLSSISKDFRVLIVENSKRFSHKDLVLSKFNNVDIICTGKNLGYGAGINSILKKSKELNSEILVTFDADGQHRIEDIKKVVEPIEQHVADVVIGSRFLDEAKEKIPGYRKLGINIITKVTNSTLKEKITDTLLSSSNPVSNYFNKPELNKLLSNHFKGIDNRKPI